MSARMGLSVRRHVGAIWLGLMAALCLALAAAALTFPPLSGRIVDQAGIIDATTELNLETKLRELEDKSGIQLVVATVKSLEDGDIETYANQLFRTWKLGEAKNNNGVLLLVAPNERKVRIEVGYGLEKTLTDALSKVIIVNAITPRFKAGDFSGGITRGVDDIITVLTTDASEWEKRPSLRAESQSDFLEQIMPFLVILLFIYIMYLMFSTTGGRRGRWVRRSGDTIFIPTSGGNWSSGSSWSGGSSWGGGGGGSSWGGGGGSSGGGGASGSW
ncbi:MAG TPA: TPM domain-containing protein [Beijerinckiaceae bacterium]|nr:TPM domain-containing protein [Beijerinckiaceae bacterium]